MTKAHELRIFFDRARKTIVFVRLTTVRLSVVVVVVVVCLLIPIAATRLDYRYSATP